MALLRGEAFIGNNVPKVNSPITAYKAMNSAAGLQLINSSHTPGIGGLGVALAKTAFAGEYGLHISLEKIPRTTNCEHSILYSESNSRFIVTVSPDKKDAFESVMDGVEYAQVGYVTSDPILNIDGIAGQNIVSENILTLKDNWKKTLGGI